MKLHPMDQIIRNADRLIAQGASIYQQWNCAHCGAKQTMPDKNVFFKRGICEECGKESDIERAGCNFMATFGDR